jgi:hypothetical protein
VLPYLGPEIIAVMQTASSSSPKRFAKWPAPSVPWQEPGQNRPVAGLVTQSELLQFKDRECPQALDSHFVRSLVGVGGTAQD